MSRHDGRILIQTVTVDFSTTPIANNTFTQVVASLPADTVRIDMTNTASDAIQIAAGAASVEKIICQVGPEIPFQPSSVLLNKTMRISLQSTFDAALASGRLTMAFYR